MMVVRLLILPEAGIKKIPFLYRFLDRIEALLYPEYYKVTIF